MLMKKCLPAALPALLLLSPWALAQETPTQDPGVSAVEAPAPGDETSAVDMAAGETEMEATGSMDDSASSSDESGDESGSTMAGPGMMGMPGMTGGPQGPGMMMGGGAMKDMTRCPKGMMGKGMMGKGMGQGMMGGMGGGQGMMGMPRGGKGGMMGGGPGMKRHYRDLRNRLDLLDARMAKIETMLEHLMQR